MVEGREHPTLPGQHLPGRHPGGLPRGRPLHRPAGEVLVLVARDDVERLPRGAALLEDGVGARHHRQRPQRLRGPPLGGLPAHRPGDVLLHGQLVHQEEPVPLAQNLERADVVPRAHPEGTAAHLEAEARQIHPPGPDHVQPRARRHHAQDARTGQAEERPPGGGIGYRHGVGHADLHVTSAVHERDPHRLERPRRTRHPGRAREPTRRQPRSPARPRGGEPIPLTRPLIGARAAPGPA